MNCGPGDVSLPASNATISKHAHYKAAVKAGPESTAPLIGRRIAVLGGGGQTSKCADSGLCHNTADAAIQHTPRGAAYGFSRRGYKRCK